MTTLGGDEYECSGLYWEQATRYLAARMSEISEDGICAGWERSIEYTIWRLGEDPDYESPFFDKTASISLVNMGRELGCWWTWFYGDSGPTRVTLSEWNELYKEYTRSPR